MKTDFDCFHIEKKSFIRLFLGLGLGALSFTLVVLFLSLTGQYRLSFSGFPLKPLLINFIFFIAVGIAEELFTRGLLQHALLRFGKWPALLIISGIFGLMHGANPGITWFAILGLTLAGIVLGMAMYTTNSLMFPIGFHIAWNWVQGSVYGISVSGTEVGASIFKAEITGQNPLFTGGEFGAESSLMCLLVLGFISACLYFYGKKNSRFSLYDTDRIGVKK